MHLTGPLVDFVDACSDRSSTPGGGAAAAVVGALGAALGEMAAAFSGRNNRSKSAKSGDSGRIAAGIEDLCRIREALLPLVESDCEAYGKVRKTLAMPRNSPRETKERTALLQEALKGALEVPLRAARLCVQGLEIVNAIAGVVNPNLITDAAASALFLGACYRASWYNVKVNLRSIKDREFAGSVTAEGESMAARVAVLESSILGTADAALNR